MRPQGAARRRMNWLSQEQSVQLVDRAVNPAAWSWPGVQFSVAQMSHETGQGIAGNWAYALRALSVDNPDRFGHLHGRVRSPPPR